MTAKATPAPRRPAPAGRRPRALLVVALSLAAACRREPPGGAAPDRAGAPVPPRGLAPAEPGGAMPADAPPPLDAAAPSPLGPAPIDTAAPSPLGPAPIDEAAPSPLGRAPIDEAASGGLPRAEGAAPPPGEGEAGPGRVYAKTRYVWVRYEPHYKAGWTGFLWLGGSAKLREPSPVRVGADCAWYAIEPRGYVCVDERGATLDPDDPVLRALRPFAPRLDRASPYRYGESRDAPRYRALPTPAEQREREGDVGARLARLSSLGAGPAASGPWKGIDPTPAPEGPPPLPSLPPGLQQDRDWLTELSTVSWSHEALFEGRSWLLTGDFKWVPKDRVAPYPPDGFRGVDLVDEAALPLAFFRGRDRPKYRRRAGGGFERTGESWPRLGRVGLTGASEREGDETFLETKDGGLYVLASDAVVPEPRALTPWGAKVGVPDLTGRGPAGRRTWIEVSIEGGWLLAYEGARPVYATLVSTGRGGKPKPGRPTLETASTPTGHFSINGKFATATMATKHEFVHSDVPWSLTFEGPYAIHAAYWHDRWGEKMSAGCVNVSVEDGRWLFHWAEPTLPEGWHGVRWEPSEGPTTQLFVRP
ncbi:MAG TPA: L,D-transpeptidase family protein [Polyangiaceae bacterium]|nr:L,D-transpeptidase family protein [Polyangiaceae bacterium]